MENDHKFEIAETQNDIKGAPLDNDKLEAEDWGGTTPIVIRAYHYDRNEYHSKKGYLLIGQAILHNGSLRPSLNVLNSETLFPDSPESDSVRYKSPSRPQEYLLFLQFRTQTSSYGPIYSFEPLLEEKRTT